MSSLFEPIKSSEEMLIPKQKRRIIKNEKEHPVLREWEKMYSSFTPTQKEIFNKHIARENMAIKGKNGTGKTYFLKALIWYFRNMHYKRVMVLAPTNASANEIGARTVHSVFHFSFGPQYKKGKKCRVNCIDELRDADVIVIDDCNKLRVDYFDAVCETIKKNNSKIKLIVAGDFDSQFPIMNSKIKWDLEEYYEKELTTGSPTEGKFWSFCQFEEWQLFDVINKLPVENAESISLVSVNGKEIFYKDEFLKKALAEFKQNEEWIKQLRESLDETIEERNLLCVKDTKGLEIKRLEDRNVLLLNCIKKVQRD